MTPIDTVSVDAGVATVGAGVRLGALHDALQLHGLTVPAGSSHSVGIAGLTLGGGLGILGRAHGLTCDHRAISDTTIRSPVGVPVRLQVRRGARRVSVDDRLIDDCAGPTTLTTPGHDRAVNRVDVSVDSAVDLAITTSDLIRDGPAGPADVMAAAHTWLARMRAGRVVWPAPDVA